MSDREELHIHAYISHARLETCPIPFDEKVPLMGLEELKEYIAENIKDEIHMTDIHIIHYKKKTVFEESPFKSWLLFTVLDKVGNGDYRLVICDNTYLNCLAASKAAE
ncbi:hypothetical protein GGF42_001067 [Coemansia sp. RSA 2424]|nr:hypothetical protein GGF42_001067 [Coemansia sp. RSA 2424]